MTEPLPLRGIHIDGRERFTLADQPAPMLDWIALDKMVIDDRYQRPLNARNWQVIQKIAANFRWSRFGPILVAPLPGGLYSIVDGQHRAHAAALCGIEAVPAMAVPISHAEQAAAFAQINTAMIRVTPHQSFKAALAAGDPVALAARDAVTAADCRMMTFNATGALKKPGEIYSVQQLLDLARRDQAWVITTTLAAIRAYDTRGRVALYTDHILRPLLAAVAAMPPSLPPPIITAVLTRNDPFHVIERMTRLAKSEAKPIGTTIRDGFVTLLRREITTRAEAAE